MNRFKKLPKFTQNMRGQSLLEYGALLLVAFILIFGCIIGAAFLLVIPFWPQILEFGTNLVSGVQRGDSASIFILGFITIVVVILFFRSRRS